MPSSSTSSSSGIPRKKNTEKQQQTVSALDALIGKCNKENSHSASNFSKNPISNNLISQMPPQ